MVSLPSPFTMQPLNLKLIPRPVPARAICNHRPRPSRRPPPREAARCRSHLLSVGSGRVHPLLPGTCCIRDPTVLIPQRRGGTCGCGPGRDREWRCARDAASTRGSMLFETACCPPALEQESLAQSSSINASMPRKDPPMACALLGPGADAGAPGGGVDRDGCRAARAARRRRASQQRHAPCRPKACGATARPSRCRLPEVFGSFRKVYEYLYLYL